ncbi:elongation factor Ts [Agrilactobacillus composti DSM 18527 = JCM 14202]|uniref:Elongation factor Ts n=1 Tax=Agrilactobacillus composti DSM 18527 = JCM 14202 TaxID=1423734 RepID=X0PGZ4_9LACO|nr:translation elongation factor Ts [Agrilactobacillus composti]KRM36835.1 elongation factor Ts [Agrilactobacillus composti DSM 18527 = JCM 14202]GAF41223.1 translation elongation factor Ts [Agrilactobacillus composti DSM 18527 = JCM 14202]
MAKISAAQVKELREKTGVGMMDAKKALVATDGDMQQAIDQLREKGVAKAAKKSDRVAAEGLAEIAIDGNKASIIEVNSETDFVASNSDFTSLVEKIAAVVAEKEPKDMDAALKLPLGDGTIQSEVTNLTAVIGEKISFRRFKVVEKSDSQVFGRYLHNGGQIAVLSVLEGADEATAKDVAMHVAAINPKYLNRAAVPSDVVEHEKTVLTEETKNEGKPEKIIPKIVEGRLNKFFSEISLADQEFVKDPDQTVEKFVASKGGKLVSFTRYEVGEGIEKKEDNFVDEVMSQIKD